MKLTKAQADHGTWALDCMRDTSGEEVDFYEDFGYSQRAVPGLTKAGVLTPVEAGTVPASEVRSMICDLEYRLCEQLRDVAEHHTSASGLARMMRCAETAYNKIRDAHLWAFDRPAAGNVQMVGMIPVDFG